jgi:uncharacterized membrane protein
MSASIIPIVVGLLLVIYGVVSIFAKDLAWEITEWSNRNRGVQSERTPQWETSSTIGGVISIGAGVICFWAAAVLTST